MTFEGNAADINTAVSLSETGKVGERIGLIKPDIRRRKHDRR